MDYLGRQSGKLDENCAVEQAGKQKGRTNSEMPIEKNVAASIMSIL